MAVVDSDGSSLYSQTNSVGFVCSHLALSLHSSDSLQVHFPPSDTSASDSSMLEFVHYTNFVIIIIIIRVYYYCTTQISKKQLSKRTETKTNVIRYTLTAVSCLML